MQRERILLVITKSNYGGAQRYVHELACEFQTRGYLVAVASGGTEGELIDRLSADHITHYPIRHFQRDINFYKELKAMFELGHIIRDFNPDVIHLNSSKAGGTGAFIARVLQVPTIVFTAHGWAFNEDRGVIWKSIVWLLSWFTGLLAHHIITVSRHDLDTTTMPGIKQKCTIIPTSLSRTNFLDRANARKKLFSADNIQQHIADQWVATVAELNANKNQTFAISAIDKYNQTHERKIFYSLIGTGDDMAKIKQHIKTCEHPQQFELLGQVPEAKIYLKAFDYFLLPSRKEGMPYAILEAMSAGLPVAASRVGGIPELVTDNIEGKLFNPDDMHTLQDALVSLSDPQKQRIYSSNAKIKSRQFTLDTMVEKTMAVYDQR